MYIWPKLDAYQIRAAEFVLSHEGSALFFDQGTGKTYIAAGVIEKLLSPTFCGFGVVPLTNLESSWVKTLAQIIGLNIARTFDELRAMPFPKLLLLNFEALNNKRLLDRIVRFTKWTLAFVDEAQRIKARGSKASKAMRRLRHVAKRFILTGTPMDANPIEVWPQMRFVEPMALGTCIIETPKGEREVQVGDNWEAFEAVYLIKCGFMDKKREFREDMREQFNEAIAPYCLSADRYESVDGLQKPKMIREVVELIGKQDKLYRDMERDAFVEIMDGKFSTPELTITQHLRLHQICGGWLVDDNGDLHATGEAKMRRVRSLIKSGRIKPPFVIFCRFLAELKSVAREMREHFDRVRLLYGGTGKGKTKAATRAGLNEAFQRGEIDVLVVQVKTGGVGIDLFKAWQAIVYSCGHSFIDFAQLVARLVRRGQLKVAEFFLLEANNTIDTDIYTSIETKRSVSELFLERMRKRTDITWPKTRRRQPPPPLRSRRSSTASRSWKKRRA